MAKLIILRGEQHRLFELRDAVVSIGRAPDNVLWLDDPSLSRRHCEIRRRDKDWWLQDGGSFNGTFVNNLSVQQHQLRPGDRIQIGTTVCYYVPEVEDGTSTAMSGPPRTSFGSDDDEDSERAAREAASRKLRNFMALLEITKAVSSELSRQRLLSLVVLKSIELVQSQRGFLVLLKGGERVFEVALLGDGTTIAEPEKVVSTSVLQSVTTDGEPVITINAQNDLGGFMSIVALEVRSLICVPLKSKDRILGALYVDSQVATQQFGDEALNLLQAFADQAAIALENATLYDEVVESREQEKRIRTVFQRYVPSEVVNQVLNLQEGARLSSKLDCTVLFSDIRGFTSISEKLQPEEVVTFLNDYLQRMVDIVFAEGGIVDKFVGDAVMAVWGAPANKPDDARRAVRACLRMLNEVERFNHEQRQSGGVEISIGMGLHTGPVIAGNMGSDKKMEYTMIGDTVNVASRVEGLNKPMGTKFLITQATLDAAGPGITATAKEPVDVKGKAEKLLVYEVTAIDEDIGEAIAPASALPPPAPGEEPEADDLHFDIDIGEATMSTFSGPPAAPSAAPLADTPPPFPAHARPGEPHSAPPVPARPPKRPKHSSLGTFKAPVDDDGSFDIEF